MVKLQSQFVQAVPRSKRSKIGFLNAPITGQTPHLFFQKLKKKVRPPASDPSLQKTYLRSLGTRDCLGELALEFDHSYATLQSNDQLSHSQALALGHLDIALARMSGDKHEALWYGSEGLQEPEWSEVRKLAAEALRCLDGDRQD